MILTNRPRSFHHTSLIEAGMTDCHKLILSLFRAFFKRIPAKTIEYRNYSKCSPEAFLHELDQEHNKGIICNSQDKQHDLFSDIFRTILDHHAPLKTKSIRGNQAKFMTKELSKSIMNKSRFKNRYLKWPSRENFLAYKKAKSLCNSLNRKAKNTYFEKATENGIMGSKKFWSTVKPFLSSKGFIHNNDIKIEIDNKMIEDESELAKTFNSHYINIVKSTTGKHPTKLGTLVSRISEKEIVATIIDKFRNHPSIISIKNEFRPTAKLNFKAATVDQINKIIRNLDAKKATGPDKIPVKVVKMSAYIINKRLTNIINNDLLRNPFSDSAKIASVRPIFKKRERTEIGNYRPVSILNCFSKIYEKFLHNQIASFSNEFLSDFISAYRKGYSINNVLIRLIEN